MLFFGKRLDGIVNFFARIGGREDPAIYNGIASERLLTKGEIDSLYLISECARVVDYYPGEMKRTGFEILLKQDYWEYRDQAREIIKQQKLLDCFCRAQKLANLYGGAIIILFVEDGQPHTEPVDREKITKVSISAIRSCYEVTPPYQGNREFYYFNYSSKKEDLNEAQKLYGHIHKSRVLRFDGAKIPEESCYYQGWGISLLQRFRDPFSLYDTGYKAANAILHKLEVPVIEIEGLSTDIALGDSQTESRLFKRLEMMKQSMTNLGGIVIDSATEKVSLLSRNLSGIDQILSLFRDRALGASGLIESVFLGKPAVGRGLGSVDQAERMHLAQQISTLQSEQWEGKLTTFVDYVFASLDAPEDLKWSIEFASGLKLTPDEQAALRESQARVDKTEIETGVVSSKEVRESRHGAPEWSSNTVLSEEHPQNN